MAASDAIPVPRKNVAFRFYFAIRKPSDSTLITTWAGMDSEVSLDGAAYSDCTSEATEIGTTGTGYIDLTSSEMNADCVMLKVTVTNTGAVPLVFVLYPESAGDYRVADTQKVDVETIKTQALTAAAGITFPSSIASPTNITAATGVVLSAVTHTGAVIPTVSTLTGHTPQTGDSFARIGATGSGLTSLAPSSTALSTAQWTNTLATNLGTTNTTVATNLDATITSRMATYTQPTGFLAATFPSDPADQSLIIEATDAILTAVGTRLATASYTSPPSVGAIADAVWDEARSGHTTAGTFGFYLDAAITGISAGSGATAQQVWEYATRTLTGAVVLDSASVNAVADQVWDEATSGHTTAGTYGGRIVRATNTNVEVQITGSNHIAADVHEFQAGVITAGDFAANSITASALATDAVTEIQSGLASQSSVDTLTSYVDTEIAAIKAKTDNLPSDPADQSLVEAAITAATSPLATPAQVNAQVLDVLTTDTFAELSAPPAATSSLKDKITWLFMYARNKVTQTALARTLYRDDTTTVAGTSATSDNGTTFTKGEDA